MKILLLLLALTLPLFGAPNIDRHFNDFSNTVNTEQTASLEEKLMAFEKNTGHQFIIAIFPKLEGDLEQTTIDLARQWKIGNKDKNDGILFAVFLQSPTGGGKMRIEIGYGLEGELTDGKTKILLDTKIKPLFKQKKFYEGFDLAINSISSILKGEQPVEETTDNSNFWFWFWVFVIILLIILLIAILGNSGGGYYGSSSSYSGSSYSSSSSGWSGGGGSFGGGGSSSDF